MCHASSSSSICHLYRNVGFKQGHMSNGAVSDDRLSYALSETGWRYRHDLIEAAPAEHRCSGEGLPVR
jgi:hypothetical protein